MFVYLENDCARSLMEIVNQLLKLFAWWFSLSEVVSDVSTCLPNVVFLYQAGNPSNDVILGKPQKPYCCQTWQLTELLEFRRSETLDIPYHFHL